MNAPIVIRSRDGELVSPELGPLLLAVHQELARRSSNVRPLHDAIERVLVFLSSPAGRTNANCWAADLFFCLGEGWGDVDWEHVPEPLGDILGDVGSALHDTIHAPAVAENFENTPEQLLSRLRALGTAKGAV